jgi:hypothetical protein
MLLQHIPAIPFPTYYGLDSVWYGYGIEVYYEGQKICYQHAGGCPGYQGRLIYLPVSNITIVHLSNSQKDNVSLNDAKKMYQMSINVISRLLKASLMKNFLIINHAYKIELTFLTLPMS